MKKIIIFGFPHCGTSILKSIIGHIDEVYEIYDETKWINEEYLQMPSNKKYILCKFPYTEKLFFSDKYKDYIKIFIIRNPLWVFSSLNKRFVTNIPNNCSIIEYIETIKLFNYYRKNPIHDLYLLRYEDMFNDNYKNLKNIFNIIGFKYNDKIFNNNIYTNYIISNIKIVPKKKPDNKKHGYYRTWQINQPFINNNDISKINLLIYQKELLQNNEYIKEIYSDNELQITI